MLYNGDMLEILKTLPENSIDTCICDPPYHLTSIVKRFGSKNAAPAKYGTDGAFSRTSQGFMGQSWDGGDIAFRPETWAAVYRVLKPGAYLLAFGGCYDDKTEILTDTGWKYFKDVTRLDKVATLNPDTEEIIYQYPTEVVKYSGYDKLIHFKTNKVDLMVTPNHKMLIKSLGGYKNSKWNLTRADNIKQAIKMKKNGIWNGERKEYFILPETEQSNGHNINKIPEKKIPMDIWLKFLGLWLAEGSSTITKIKSGYGYKTQICHFNNKNLDKLEDELKPYFSIRRYRDSGKFIINNKQLAEYLQPFCYSYNKHIPENIKWLCSDQLKILLDWYMRGDSDGRRCYTVSKKLADDLQEIALKIGISADCVITKTKNGTISGREIIGRYDTYTVSINYKQNEPEVYQRKNKEINVKSTVNYDGFVYCVEVEKYHTLYVRRNGKTVWCGNTRTFHRMVCAVEDAGFIPVDTIVWAHGQGFPKALNLSKAIDRHLGAEREVSGEYGSCGYKSSGGSEQMGVESGYKGSAFTGVAKDIPVTPEATLWNGWRSALKPAIELITLAMKPLDGTYAENALKWGVSGFNIEEARIPAESIPINKLENWSGFGQLKQPEYEQEVNEKGRYPSNLIIDDSDEVKALFPNSKSTGGRIGKKDVSNVNIVPAGNYCAGDPGFGDNGSAARFFYVSKPSKAEKNIGLEDFPLKQNMHSTYSDEGLINNGRHPENRTRETQNFHPTVKAIELMRHLVTLTKTPTGGIVLDPFMGSGTTGCACALEGREFIGIEMSMEYFEIAKKRIEYYAKQPNQISLL